MNQNNLKLNLQFTRRLAMYLKLCLRNKQFPLLYLLYLICTTTLPPLLPMPLSVHIKTRLEVGRLGS